MEATYWLKQTKAKPLFPDLIWDKPETKAHAGKLLIIGGNAHSFAAVAAAFQTSGQAGAGTVKALLPDVLKKTIGSVLENGEFAPSNKSGSFGKHALAEWLSFAGWSDGTLLPGDLGRNSETAIVLESLLKKYNGILTITRDALDYYTANPLPLLSRNETIIVASFAQLQKIMTSARSTRHITFDMPVASLVEILHTFTTIYPAAVVLRHNGLLFVAKDGEVSTTKTEVSENFWRVETASRVTVWAIQNPSKLFAAATTAIYDNVNDAN